MNEIEEIHDLSLEWGAILNLATRIADIEDKIGPWDDLTNMVASLLDGSRTSTPQSLAQDVYPFLFRLYFRLKAFESPTRFNRVFLSERDLPDSDNPQYKERVAGFGISNYDYKTYLWARRLGMADFISNNDLWVPKSSLTPAQIKHLEKEANGVSS